MKDKGGKKVPNCVPESVNEQDDSMTMAKDMKKKKKSCLNQMMWLYFSRHREKRKKDLKVLIN